MQKTQRTFTKEFKLEAVQLVKSSHKPLAQIARDLGIADSTLHHWRKLETSQGEQAFPGSGHQTAQEEEIRLYWLLGSSVRENHCKSERAYLLWLQKTYSSGTM